MGGARGLSFFVYCHERRRRTTHSVHEHQLAQEEKNHEIGKMGFRKRKRRSVAVALTLSAFAAVTVLILAQRWNIPQEGDDGLLVLPSSSHLEHSVKGN